MPVTVTITHVMKSADKKWVYGTLALDSSYPSNGYDLSNKILPSLEALSVLGGGKGYDYDFDAANCKLLVYNDMATHTHTFTGSALAAHNHDFTGEALAAHGHAFTGSELAAHGHAFTGDAMSLTPTTLGGEPTTKLLQNDAGVVKSTDVTAIGLGTPAGANAETSGGTPSGANAETSGGTPAGSNAEASAGTPAGSISTAAVAVGTECGAETNLSAVTALQFLAIGW